MRRRLLVGILLAVFGRTSFSDTAKAGVPARACKPRGGVLFEVDQLVLPKVKRTTSKTWLYGNGAWKTQVFDADGQVARTRDGCLEQSRVDSVLAGLRTAKFATTRSDASCRNDQPRFTVYRWKGKKLYTDRTCNVDVLDPDSRNVLDLIEDYLSVPTDLDGEGEPRPRGHLRPQCIENPLAAGCK